MALDVFLLEDERELCFQFEDDGFYWYLYPLIEELRERTGIFIDLYGDAEFNKGNINQFESMLKTAKELISKEPDYFTVVTGMQIEPEKKEIKEKVSKREFLSKLDQLEMLVDEVRTKSACLLFFGD